MPQATHKLFQQTLKRTLDTHHPYWTSGYKGKEKHRMPFTSVIPETLWNWVKGPSKLGPQRGKFSEFLEEAELPDDVTEALRSLHEQMYTEYRDRRVEASDDEEAQGDPLAVALQEPAIPSTLERQNLLNGTALLVVLCLAAWVVFYWLPGLSGKTPLRELQHLNGWCSAIPNSLLSTGSASYFLAVSDAAQLGDFSEHPYYIYFDNQFIGADTLNLEGRDAQLGQWQFSIAPTWVATHVEWMEPSQWHIDYRCGR